MVVVVVFLHLFLDYIASDLSRKALLNDYNFRHLVSSIPVPYLYQPVMSTVPIVSLAAAYGALTGKMDPAEERLILNSSSLGARTPQHYRDRYISPLRRDHIHPRPSFSVDRSVQISIQTFLWAISFPIGMVLGLSK